MKTKVIKIHFKKAKPKYHKFYIKKKKTKNGKSLFCKKIKKFFFRFVTFDVVNSPAIGNAKMKIIEEHAKDYSLRFPTHEILAVQSENPDNVFIVAKGRSN